MRTAALIAWLATIGGGLVMLTIWFGKGGVRQVPDETTVGGAPTPTTRPTTRLDPYKVGTHVLMALVSLVVFVGLLAVDDEGGTGYSAAPWLVLGGLLVTAGFGLAMAVPWYRDRKARGRGARKPAEQSIPFAIVGLHGLAAATTIVLVALVALGID